MEKLNTKGRILLHITYIVTLFLPLFAFYDVMHLFKEEDLRMSILYMIAAIYQLSILFYLNRNSILKNHIQYIIIIEIISFIFVFILFPVSIFFLIISLGGIGLYIFFSCYIALTIWYYVQIIIGWVFLFRNKPVTLPFEGWLRKKLGKAI